MFGKRESVITLFEFDSKNPEISRMFNVSELTIRNVIKRFKDTGNSEDIVQCDRPLTGNTPPSRRGLKILLRKEN